MEIMFETAHLRIRQFEAEDALLCTKIMTKLKSKNGSPTKAMPTWKKHKMPSSSIFAA